MKSRPQERYAVSVRALHRLYAFSTHVRRKNGGSGGQSNFQEWLRLVFEDESHLGERFTFRRDHGCDDRAFGLRGEHATVGKSYPLQRQRGRLARLFVVTECRLRRKMRQRPQIGIRLFHVHALEAATFRRSQFHGACALDEHFAGFALCPFKAEEWRIRLGCSDGTLHRYQELVAAPGGRIYLKRQNSRLSFRGIQRSPGHAGNFISRGQLQLELRRLTLHDRDIGQDGHAHFRFADRDQRFCVREKSHLARHGWGGGFSSSPPDGCRLSGHQRGFNQGVFVLGFPTGDQAWADIRDSVVPGNHHCQLHAARSRYGQAEGSSSRLDS